MLSCPREHVSREVEANDARSGSGKSPEIATGAASNVKDSRTRKWVEVLQEERLIEPGGGILVII
jgi:hypothetical protein